MSNDANYNNNMTSQEQLEYNKKVYEALKKCEQLGLDDDMRQSLFTRRWPAEAERYPGGPLAVIEEAIEQKKSWKEICNYKREPPPPGVWIE